MFGQSFDVVLMTVITRQIGLILIAQHEKIPNASNISELACGLSELAEAVCSMKEAGISELTKEHLDLHLAKSNLMAREVNADG